MLNKKTVVIVANKDFSSAANYLEMLVTSHDDDEDKIVGTKDDTIATVVHSEEEYLKNKIAISSNQYILFLGSFKTEKENEKYMDTVYNEFGIKYAYKGHRAIITVDKKALSSSEKVKFISLCKDLDVYGSEQYKKVHQILEREKKMPDKIKYVWDKIKDKKLPNGNKIEDITIPNSLKFFAGFPVTAIIGKLDNDKIYDIKCFVAITQFYLKYFNDFLEG